MCLFGLFSFKWYQRWEVKERGRDSSSSGEAPTTYSLAVPQKQEAFLKSKRYLCIQCPGRSSHSQLWLFGGIVASLTELRLREGLSFFLFSPRPISFNVLVPWSF